MAEYRAYLIGENGHIKNFRAFVCGSDADAIVWAKQLLDDNDIELWCGDRFVGRFNHQEAPALIGGYSRTHW